MTTRSMNPAKPTGPAAAALVAAGLGTFVIGMMTTLAAASAGLRNALVWYSPSGPLSGKTGVGLIAWLLAWVILHSALRGREVNLGRAFTLAIVLIAAGFLLTFPPVFEAFE
jgi:hypothetical protein